MKKDGVISPIDNLLNGVELLKARFFSTKMQQV